VVRQVIEHGEDGGAIAEQLAPVFHRSVRCGQGGGGFVPAYDDPQQLLGGSYPQRWTSLSMVWWAVVGGLVVAFQVYAGLTSVNRVGAGTFVGLTIDGNPGTHHIAPSWTIVDGFECTLIRSVFGRRRPALAATRVIGAFS
jgi:hypothetical protein